MFCPECKAEYRQGFTRCSDCDVDLVYALQEPRQGATSLGAELQLMWRGNHEAECVAVCRDLMKAAIPYKVAQIPESRNLRMSVKWRYEIGVPTADYQRAKDLLGIEGEFVDARDSGDEEDDAESLPPDDSLPDEEVRNDSYLNPWYPEDATVEIWSQDGDDFSSGIEMALGESLIHCRLDVHDGARKAFVMPEDEQRSRKIVYEVTEGRPLG
jgi:hypothetical protein